MESEKLIELNKKIAELKKRILLAEGQKKANSEEWEKQKRANSELVSTLKKEIKELTSKLTYMKNPLNRRQIKDPPEVGSSSKIQYPVGAKNAEEALEIMDLKVTDNRKQLDLIRDKYKKRQTHFNKLVEEYRDLLAYKDSHEKDINGKPPETLEEDANRKLVCHLENEIHRTNVQWMEAEHIRKKYLSIKASLMTDAERFERSLKELENALTEQRAEVNRLQEVHKESIDMRDAAKIILQKQEQQANQSTKARERQAVDFRKQVDERKVELERIERKLFSTGKTLVHQDSIGSSSGDNQTGKTEQDDDPSNQLKSITSEMEETFKSLMEVTGATSAQEVLNRFISQKESTSRLTYLRTAAEAEKKHLESEREMLLKELEASKFTDIKESEVNQELLEKLKNDINRLSREQQENLETSRRTQKVIKSIKEALCDMIYKLQEIDEMDIQIAKTNQTILSQDLPTFLLQDATDEDLINVLEEKLKRGLQLPDEINDETAREEIDEGELSDELNVVIPTESRSPSIIEEKPQPIPICYYNLVSGRAAQTSSASPGPTPQPAPTDDENEVPSRSFLKRQAVVIVDSKSRRKGFRPPAPRRK